MTVRKMARITMIRIAIRSFPLLLALLWFGLTEPACVFHLIIA